MVADAVARTLKHAWGTLEPLHLPMALMGGLALAVWKHIRLTRDVDLLVSLGHSDVDALLRSLQVAGMRPRHQPPVLNLGPTRVLQLLYEPPDTFMDMQIDLLFADSVYAREALKRRVAARLPNLDLDLFVLSCEDLILHKLSAGRIIDRADAASLLRLNRDELEVAYLQDWIGPLGLTSSWSEIWTEAFPNDLMPK
jgi:hypothetical protein